MQYKVLKIEEDMDFGCEERQPGEALMSVVLVEDENGNIRKNAVDDMAGRDSGGEGQNPKYVALLAGQHQLWKL